MGIQRGKEARAETSKEPIMLGESKRVKKAPPTLVLTELSSELLD